MIRGRHVGLHAELAQILDPAQVSTRAIDRIAHANDASVYRIVPRAVVRPGSIAEIQALFRLSHRLRVPLTFRAAGTSLSGQAVTDGILVDVARHWREMTVLDGGRRVRVQPGVIAGSVNASLAAHGTKIGPDPASIHACMMGGVLANNSSGMCCGVQFNAYHTLDSIRFVLPSGLELDSGDPHSAQLLRTEEPALHAGLLELRRRILENPELLERIRRKYRLKNTMGYSLNALVDHDEPLEILAHLLIGSEGTLAFIAEAVLRTVPDLPHKLTGLLFFDDVPSACAAVLPLRDSGAVALELMDRASLRAIAAQPGAPPGLDELAPGAAAILVEYQSATPEALAASSEASARLLPRLPLSAPPRFTANPAEQAALWRLRQGLIPAVGARRPRGTSFIMEDVVFPPERLAEGVAQLQELFRRHGYDDAIVFGHARDGNLHFVLVQAFEQPREVARFEGFMDELAQLVAVRHGGALKAEHGTGRNMAPYVETEWGRDALELMRELKRLIDPSGLLNPGVILNDDPQAHVRHLKTLTPVDALIDDCIECGFCERLCPSRHLTLTPRQRIVVRREMTRLRLQGQDPALLAELERDWPYEALETCAVDGLCATGCPVSIDTGRFVQRLRADERSATAQELARWSVHHLALGHGLARTGLRAVRALRPTWNWPAPARRPTKVTPTDAADALYFPSCAGRIVDDDGLAATLLAVAARAGQRLTIPPGVPGMCCGLAFASKGFERAAREAARMTLRALWASSDRGRLPVIIDASPCGRHLEQQRNDATARGREPWATLRLLDSIEFADQWVRPRLLPLRRAEAVVVHPVCSVVRRGLTGALHRVASTYARHAEIPLSAGCCGFAGDRGLHFPELTAAATRDEAREIRAGSWAGCYSSSLTCELGLTRATGLRWRSFWHLIDASTSAEPLLSGQEAPAGATPP